MFNFLVTASDGAWDLPGYEYPRGRFLEYTSDEIAASFRQLKELQLKALMELPCLFAYEGTDEPMRVGRLNSVKLRNNGSLLYIRPEFDPQIPPIPYEQIEPLKTALDIRDWELNRTHWAIKDEDLYEVLIGARLAPDGMTSPRVTKTDLPPASTPEFQANSVGAFIENVLDMNHHGREVFYRGHSNRSRYRLEPAILRKDDRGNFIYRDAEDRMYRELLVSNSVDFHGDVYTLDRLVRMQHYSLPTRLLDITSNPLIALYFACKSNLDDDGEVIVFSMDRHQIKYFDSDTASCIANLTRLPQDSKESIDYSSNDVRKFNRQLAVKRLLHFVKEEKPFFESRVDPRHLRSVICVKGKHTNSRIAFQSGAFLLFGHDATLDEGGTPEISVKRIGVSNKPAVLRQLDQLNINESTVFPYIESSAKYIASKFQFKDI
ncbi:FRG domain-containing protein [Pseudoxanthomonas wuyuanensis]|uniref:FRG domain-containing protein n=1 Tax=Pseudoxanthomonas wuyuanensis TaxID=1073196 RepID=A0A286D7Y6_9GAMM|nr:FRG domain-containing protein [Pseudoxanthomonas wuyuanensis]KAF1720155.1 FRG domain-containing protein [Pseudoxanthomonas wuyuanensis]SOD54782.1 FRG domain-containing protein [Pseudoxanthomonas wuyuanensis]